MTRFHAVRCLVLACLMVAPAVGCSSGGMRNRHAVQYPMAPGDTAPGATGRVSVRQTDQNNQKLQIQVAHLPPPGQLHPSLSTYVVWGSQPGQPGTAMNLGQITIDRSRSGKLDVVTPYPNLDLKVTAESSATPERPSEYVILQGNVMGGAIR